MCNANIQLQPNTRSDSKQTFIARQVNSHTKTGIQSKGQVRAPNTCSWPNPPSPPSHNQTLTQALYVKGDECCRNPDQILPSYKEIWEDVFSYCRDNLQWSPDCILVLMMMMMDYGFIPQPLTSGHGLSQLNVNVFVCIISKLCHKACGDVDSQKSFYSHSRQLMKT